MPRTDYTPSFTVCHQKAQIGRDNRCICFRAAFLLLFFLFLLQFYHVSFHVASCILFAPSSYSAGKRCLAGREEARQPSAMAGVLPAAESPPKLLPVCLYMQTCLFYPFFLPSLFGYFILSSTLCSPAICLPSHQVTLKGNTMCETETEEFSCQP